MGIIGETIRENEAEDLCNRLAEKIKKYPEAAKALKELGLEWLDDLFRIYRPIPTFKVPEWAEKFYRLFRE